MTRAAGGPDMQRLYLQFYATILLVLAVFVGAAVLTWRLAEEQTPQYMDVAAELTGALLPDADAPQEEDQKALDALHRKLRFDLALYRPDGSLLAVAGRPPPRFDPNRARWLAPRRNTAHPLTPPLPHARAVGTPQARTAPPPSLGPAGL